ncbi:67_t:CDS:2 [Funneliformis caledonium]|uniref:67_t:CDS:1 n=1 Tax=Funneliformis caledonium TaxID=1117310 RepID=A0A9N9G465_9GLOM|nr:67_t:CDS:2 [Funneliformis caledonium]
MEENLAFKRKVPLYPDSQKNFGITSATQFYELTNIVNTSQPFDKQAYNELLNLEIFEFNQENYNNVKSIFEQEAASDDDNASGIACLSNCFPDGILRIEAIFLQDVISIQKKNSHQAISDKQTPTDSTNIVDQDGSPKKKQRQTHHETKLEEKELLELLVTYSEYPTSDQINQVGETLGNEWDKNQINQYISRHRRNKNNNHE